MINAIDTIKPQYTRVTDALFFISGLSAVNPDVLKKAADRGTRAHLAIDAIIKGIGVLPDSTIDGYIHSFNSWYTNKKFIDMPKRAYCDDILITGLFDGIYEDNQELVLVDFKTPMKESRTWRLQLSAYAYLARKNGFNIKRIEAVKLDRYGSVPRVFVYEEDFPMYLNCLQVYRQFFKDHIVENYMDYL